MGLRLDSLWTEGYDQISKAARWWGIMIWAGIINNEVVGPFRVEQGVKINSENYCQFLKSTLFKQRYKLRKVLKTTTPCVGHQTHQI